MRARHVDTAVEACAGTQGGVFSRAQVLAARGTDKVIVARLASGRWQKVAPGVYRFPVARPSYEQALWVAVLAAGRSAVVSHEAAAALHGFLGFPEGPRVVTVAHSSFARLSGVTVHQITDLTPRWCTTTLGGLPLSTPARTFVDLAPFTRRLRLRRALDDARSARTTTIEEVSVALEAVRRRGKPGVRLLGSVLDELGPGSIPSASALEERLHEVIENAALPPLTRQYPFPGRQLVTGCVDGAWPEAQLVVEADSRRWHTRVEDLSRDNLRDQEAARAGWLVLRVMLEHLVSDAAGVVDNLRTTRLVRLRQVA